MEKRKKENRSILNVLYLRGIVSSAFHVDVSEIVSIENAKRI